LKLLADGQSHILVTGPINKQYFQEAGYDFQGHTDFLKSRTKSEAVYMMFASESVNVLLITHHLPLKEVTSKINKNEILKLLKFIHRQGSFYGLNNQAIAITGLNPHAGEGGQIGREEIEHSIPALEEAEGWGMQIEGPIPADAIFRPEIRNKYNLIIAMYHDQGLVGVKALGPSVNISVGLPFIRTSVDHGTAYDIAGKNEADYSSFVMALEKGLVMFRNSSLFTSK